jgi:hypothetical protein
LFGHLWHPLIRGWFIPREVILGVGEKGTIFKIDFNFNDNPDEEGIFQRGGLVYGTVPSVNNRTHYSLRFSKVQQPNGNISLSYLLKLLKFKDFERTGILYLPENPSFRRIFLGLDNPDSYLGYLGFTQEIWESMANLPAKGIVDRIKRDYSQTFRPVKESLSDLTRGDGHLFYRVTDVTFEAEDEELKTGSVDFDFGEI